MVTLYGGDGTVYAEEFEEIRGTYGLDTLDASTTTLGVTLWGRDGYSVVDTTICGAGNDIFALGAVSAFALSSGWSFSAAQKDLIRIGKKA